MTRLMMRALLWIAAPLIAAGALAQPNHYLGLGTYLTMPQADGSYDLAQNENTVVRFSPLLDYTMNAGRLNVSAGIGNWNSTLSGNLVFSGSWTGTGFAPTGDAAFVQGHNYAMLPLTVGFNAVDGWRLKAGVEGTAQLKYLYMVRQYIVSNNPLLQEDPTFLVGGEIDDAGLRRLNTAAGGGLYAAWDFGRVYAKLGSGYIVDMTNAWESPSLVNYSFTHPYASVSVRYMLHRIHGHQKHDRRVKW